MISFEVKCDIIYRALKLGLTIEMYGNPLSLAAGAVAADVVKAAEELEEEQFMQIAANVAIQEAEEALRKCEECTGGCSSNE
jgi:hypothetical protein